MGADVEAAEPSRALNELQVLGVSYRTAALKTRSAVSFTEEGLETLLADLRNRGVSEALALCTCNRTEVYFAGCRDEVLAALTELSEVPKETILEASYVKEGDEAVGQIFRVASGLDSAVLGENEILGQLKAAFGLSKRTGMAGPRINALYQRALRVSKRGRTESEVSRHVTSVAAMALRPASKLAGGLDGKKILLIGAGQIAERMAKELSHVGARDDAYVTNRTSERAERLATLYGLRTWAFADLDEALRFADVVVAAVSSDIPLLSGDRLARVCGDRNVVVVDLGVPPNVEACDTVRLLDMDAIVRECSIGSERRAKAVPKAEAIVTEEVEAFHRESLEREAAPYIEALVKMADEVRQRNLDWALAQTHPESAKERKLLEDLSIRLVRGILQAPIQALKSDLREPVERGVLARLFAVEVR